MVTSICHFKLDPSAGQLLVDIAREKAYQTGNYSSGIAFLFASGIEDYSYCEMILNGTKTLIVDTDEEGHQVFCTVDDTWTPPFIEKDEINEVLKFCDDIVYRSGWSPGSDAAWKSVLSDREQGQLYAEVELLRELTKYNPSSALQRMKLVKEMHIETVCERVVCTVSNCIDEELIPDYGGVPVTNDDKSTFVGSRAKKHLESCLDTDCKYCRTQRCVFGLRDTAGCIRETPELETHLEEIEALGSFGDSAKTIIQYKETKVYSFELEGHQYTYIDSARNQSECPHCGKTIYRIDCISPIEDKDKFYFVGVKQLAENQVAMCFQCLECGEYFFYHMDISYVINLLAEYPELEELIKL